MLLNTRKICRRSSLSLHRTSAQLMTFVVILLIIKTINDIVHGFKEERLVKNMLHETIRKISISNHDIVIYNRIPKCGSTYLITLFRAQSNYNSFKVISPYIAGEKETKSNFEQKEIISYLKKEQKPLMYIRHMYFVDFKRYKSKRPVYINIVRDPVERFQSHYYYVRFGNLKDPSPKGKFNHHTKYQTIDECVRDRQLSCVSPMWKIVPYFCGQDERCLKASSWAVERAKHNIVEHYVFVGVTEYLRDTMKILEILLPEYFSSLAKVSERHEYLNRIKNGTTTVNKTHISNEAIQYLKDETSLRLEYELYNFIVERMFMLKSVLNIT